MCRGEERFVQGLSGNTEGKKTWYLGVEEGVILKWSFQK